MEDSDVAGGGHRRSADGPSRVARSWRGTLAGVVRVVASGLPVGGAVVGAVAGDEGEQ